MNVYTRSDPTIVLIAEMTLEEAKFARRGLAKAINTIVTPEEELQALRPLYTAISARISKCASCSS
jgi:hypothetical protein